MSGSENGAVLAEGVARIEQLSYRGKRYQVPIFDTAGASEFTGAAERAAELELPSAEASPVMRCLATMWDLREFEKPRCPVGLGTMTGEALASFVLAGAVRVLDLPIKMPDNPSYRVPRALQQFVPVIRRVADIEARVNPRLGDYHAYLTIDQRWVEPGTLHREAPCHVDGFQGARWAPKCLINHSYTVSDVLPTAYYVQPFDFSALDERVHDYFWEMNAQVADTNEAHRWQPAPAELTLMDCYSVHRGVENESSERVFRTWLRLSFEERRRVFDRLGNAHNPLFDYAWPMLDRDIEQLGLRAFRATGDASLRVFPWQDVDGRPLPEGARKTKPRLRA